MESHARDGVCPNYPLICTCSGIMAAWFCYEISQSNMSVRCRANISNYTPGNLKGSSSSGQYFWAFGIRTVFSSVDVPKLQFFFYIVCSFVNISVQSLVSGVYGKTATLLERNDNTDHPLCGHVAVVLRLHLTYFSCDHIFCATKLMPVIYFGGATIRKMAGLPKRISQLAKGDKDARSPKCFSLDL